MQAIQTKGRQERENQDIRDQEPGTKTAKEMQCIQDFAENGEVNQAYMG